MSYNNKKMNSYYTGGYTEGENTYNFRIINADKSQYDDYKYIPLIKVCKNILLRGKPTNLSKYLKETVGDISKCIKINAYIDKTEPDWFSKIKGGQDNNYPAAVFFYKLIPEYIEEYAFIKQLLLPEVLINDIVNKPAKSFVSQQVDFYLPQAKLVIEIDGTQHENKSQKLKDTKRDEFLKRSGIYTIRFKTSDIKEKTEVFFKQIDLLKKRLKLYEKNLKDYKEYFNEDFYNLEESRKSLRLNAIFRFQICILHLLECNILNINQSEWKIAVHNHEISGYEKIAINDLFIWIKNLCVLKGLPFHTPKIKILNNFTQCDDTFIKVDNSLLKRWTSSLFKKDIICIRSDYFDEKNYFRVSIADPIKYEISNDSEEQREALQFLLNNIFEFDEFKLGQVGAIINSLRGEDTIGLLPTGGGKSLIYQLVALLQPGITYVVVPIVALMEDQLDNMRLLKINNVGCINSSQSSEEKEAIQNQFEKGRYQIILISPERFQIQAFRKKLVSINYHLTFALAVIDEVHCLSEWGHDFRTSYLNLKKAIIRHSPSARILGLTATASLNVIKDIKAEFEIENVNIKTLPDFTRKELNFHIIRDRGVSEVQKIQNLKEIILKENNKLLEKEGGKYINAAIVFTRFVDGKKGCYYIAQELSKIFSRKVEYFSGKAPKDHKSEIEYDKYKSKIQKEFKNSRFPLLVATKAFGMGIDKANIRTTIHYVMPPSLESLYQEAGRAGRDGNKANCYVIFSDEYRGKRKIQDIFDIRTPVNKIKDIVDGIKWDGRDIISNMWLWLKDLKGFSGQKEDVINLYNNFAKPNYKVAIYGEEMGLNKQDLEKAIYRLSILGIIEDWTIEQWQQDAPIIEIYFSDYSEKSINEHLFNYIHKYDVEFSIDNPSNNFDYKSYYYDKSMTILERALSVLLIWQYENIISFRKESVRTVYEQCKKEQSPEEFKSYMENYFRFDDMTFGFDYIAENPLDYNEWFKLFFNKEGYIEKETIKNSIPALRRYLESYINNTGLNFITGIAHLLVGDNQHEPIDRLRHSFTIISNLNDDDKNKIFHSTLKLGNEMKMSSKNILSSIIISFYNGKEKEIFKELNDEYSLNKIINDSIVKMKIAKEKIKWQI